MLCDRASRRGYTRQFARVPSREDEPRRDMARVLDDLVDLEVHVGQRLEQRLGSNRVHRPWSSALRNSRGARSTRRRARDTRRDRPRSSVRSHGRVHHGSRSRPMVAPRGPLGLGGAVARGIDGGEGLVDRVVEVLAVERLEQAVPVDEVAGAGSRSSTNARWMPCAFSSVSSRSSMSAAVTSMSVIASHWSTTQLGRRFADEATDLLAEHAGVGEEQRRLPAVHEHAGSLLGRRAPSSRCASPPDPRPARAPRRAATSCAGRTAGSTARRR